MLLQLPKDIMPHIYRGLRPFDIGRLRTVCKHLCGLVDALNLPHKWQERTCKEDFVDITVRMVLWPEIGYVYREAAYVYDNDRGCLLCIARSLIHNGHEIICLRFHDDSRAFIYMIDPTRARRSIIITSQCQLFVLCSRYSMSSHYQINGICEYFYSLLASSLYIDNKVNMKKPIKHARTTLRKTYSIYETLRHITRPNIIKMMTTVPRAAEYRSVTK